MIVAAADLDNFVERIFSAAGSASEEARVIAAHLVEANLTGHDSHGISLIPEYLKNLKAGNVKPNAKGKLVRSDGSILVYDGERGYGQVIGRLATDLAIATAKKSGLALLALRNSYHIGRVGTYGEQCARAGLVSIHFVNAIGHQPRVAPHGGRDARLPTNPFCVAIPATEHQPMIVLDMATSKIAQGKVRVARNSGKQLPPGMLLDEAGEPTIDPNVMFNAPPGSILTVGEHKGYGISLVCEILAGVFTEGTTIHPGNKRDGSALNNMLMIVFDPGRTSNMEWARREIDQLVDYVKASPSQSADRRVMVPGDPERASKKARLSGGLPVDDGTWSQVCEAARAVGVNDCPGAPQSSAPASR
jgi:uncharacterized oxidoreductase